jgi:hypothetical protein
MKKFISLFLVLTFIGMNCAIYEKGEGINLEPGQKPGVKLKIQKKDGQELQGELITVKKDSLLLKDTGSGADVSVDVSNINKITIVKGSKAGIGLLAGLLIGIASAKFVIPEKEAGEAAPVRALYSGLATLIGFYAGAAIGIDKKIQIERKSDSEIQEILESLRKKARVPDFQ